MQSIVMVQAMQLSFSFVFLLLFKNPVSHSGMEFPSDGSDVESYEKLGSLTPVYETAT